MTNKEDSAYPVHGGYLPDGNYDDPRNQIIQGGLTKREDFSAKVLQGLCAHYGLNNKELTYLAKKSVEIADELIKALNK